MRLTLLVPELIWPEPTDQNTLGKLSRPGFEWLAARAAYRRQPAAAFEIALARQFGLATPSLGALRLLGEDVSAGAVEGHWLCADPVHLRFHHERIVLADAGAFDLAEDEAREIAAALNAEFADIGQLHVATARRWYLRLNPAGSAFAGASGHVAPPLSAVAGRRVDSEISEHDATLTRWLNEVQMFLHGHPLNTRREQAGQPVLNSLWLWGGGHLTRPSPGQFSAVWSNHPLATGLARAAGTPAHPLPAGLAGLLQLASSGSAPLVVLDTLLPPVLYEDSDGWRQAWQQLETSWFAPLRRSLGRPVRELNIVAPTIYGELHWSLRGIDRWKFWRRSRPLAALAGEIAEGKP
ncbi:MAG: hypothetical protein CVU18_02190 [Betaproteobacteria bacterium HGW-Betaproteobacteria-12]|nr:MAG: hypothetical protein CVU18_02190 [Betaproteobacteria bacterium HGW-Betaproteobacteria-12]